MDDLGDGNARFLQRFVECCKLYTQASTCDVNISLFSKTKQGRKSASYIFVSTSCTLKYPNLIPYTHCVPLIQKKIRIMTFKEAIDSDTQRVKVYHLEKYEKISFADGLIYVTVKMAKLTGQFMTNEDDRTYAFGDPKRIMKDGAYRTADMSDLPAESVDKYKNSPPPIEELLRFLGPDFTLYYGFSEESTIPRGKADVLSASIRALNRGGLFVECVDVLVGKTQTIIQEVVNLCWNGIVIHQVEGEKNGSDIVKLVNKAQTVCLRNLGQHCYTVKAKESFYNKGLPPLCQDKDKLDEVFRVVNMTAIRSCEELKKEFSSVFENQENPLKELLLADVLGKSKDLLKCANRCAIQYSLAKRRLKFTNNKLYCYNMVFYRKELPGQIRDRLLKTPYHEDVKFSLIPPCGVSNDYYDFIKQRREKIISEELYALHEKVSWPDNVDATENPPKMPTESSKKKLCPKKKTAGELPPEVDKIMQHELTLVPARSIRPKTKETYCLRKLNLLYKVQECTSLFISKATIRVPNGRDDWVAKTRQESDLPMPLCRTYEHTPPPDQVLWRILGDDFVLYYGFTIESTVYSGNTEVLAYSFNSLFRSVMIVEYAYDWHVEGFPVNTVVKFKWNGITVYQELGSSSESFNEIRTRGIAALINKLGHRFSSLVAKRTYYNDGLAPKCQDEEALDKVLRVVKRSEFFQNHATIKTRPLELYINRFFKQDENRDMELLFGTDFSVKELSNIQWIARKTKQLCFRYLKSTAEMKRSDTIVVYVKRSPSDIVHWLVENTSNREDMRFFITPPCPPSEEDYRTWLDQWIKDFHPEEKIPRVEEHHRDEKNNDMPETSEIGLAGYNEALLKDEISTIQSQPEKREAECLEAETTAKKPKLELGMSKVPWHEIVMAKQPLVVVWPLDIHSKQERDPKKVLEANFPTEVSSEPNQRVAVYITFPRQAQEDRTYCVCVRGSVYNATKDALDLIIKHGSLIKYSNKYAPRDGVAPDFVRYNVPCQTNPRTYILMNKDVTGPLTEDCILQLFEAFKPSVNEDLFFDKDSYSKEEKLLLLYLAPKHGFKVRHFGDDHQLQNRYVCVYKAKSKDAILEELLRLGDLHPKYVMALNRLPIPLKYNSF